MMADYEDNELFDSVHVGVDSDNKELYDWPNPCKSGFIDVPGGRVFYRLYGKDKKGIPIIHVHGGPGGKYTKYYTQLPLSKDRPILVYSQLGGIHTEVSKEYQNKEKFKSLLTLDRYIDELNIVINYFKFNQFVLHGSSFGCMLSVEYAYKYKHQGLKAIILSGPFLNTELWIEDQIKLVSKLKNGEEMLFTIRECEKTGNYTEEFERINKVYSKNFNNRHKESDINLRVPNIEGEPLEIDGVTVYNHMWGKSEFSCTGNLLHMDSTSKLKDIYVPILYICGEYDSGTPETARYYNSLTNNGKVAVIPDVAHCSGTENPKMVNEIVSEFMKNIE